MLFEEALQLQERLQRDLGIKFENMTVEEVIDYIRKYALALTVEVVETLNETEWKPWKPGELKINHLGYRQELADVFIFFMNLMLADGIEADEMMQYVLDKININRHRMGLT